MANNPRAQSLRVFPVYFRFVFYFRFLICVLLFFICVFYFFYLRFLFLFVFYFFYLRFLFFKLRFLFFICVFFFFICVFFFLIAFSFFYLRFLFCLRLSLLGHRTFKIYVIDTSKQQRFAVLVTALFFKDLTY